MASGARCRVRTDKALAGPRWQDHIDYISLQALLLKHKGLSIVGQINSFWRHTKRLCD